MANSDISALASLDDVIAKDSLADKYINSVYSIRAAVQRQTGTKFEGFDLVAGKNGWKVCTVGNSSDCSTYDEFRFDSEDMIIDCHRDGHTLREINVASDGQSTEGDGVVAIPLAGRRLPGADSTEYAIRIRNTRDSAVSVSRCMIVENATGQTRFYDSFPSQKAESWQDLDVYCEFNTANVGTPQYLGLTVVYADGEQVNLWSTFRFT